MAKTPNYNHERRERDRAKAAKKAEKLAAKQAARERGSVNPDDQADQLEQPASEAK